MEHLPDDVLLEVMQHLDVRHLFALRLVCKRFESLALSPHLWRNLYVSGHSHNGCYGCPALRLAPCLRHMSLRLPLERHHQLYATTRCGVSNLFISVHDDAGGTAGAGTFQADLVIRNQEALGRMTILELYLAPDINKTVLLRTVATISGLESLRISCYSRAFPLSLTGLSMPRSSLKHFSCPHQPRSEAFCNLMLTTHAATLEHVDLFDEYTPTSATAPLLAAIPNLRQLECCILPGLGAVGAAACESLTSLELHIIRGEPGESFESRMREAAELLRHAKQLRRLELNYNSSDVSMPAAADTDLILALAPAGRRSRLEWLRICNGDDDRDGYSYQLETLWDLLPSLPCLRHLDVGPVPFEFLLRVTPETTPALRTLMVFTESGDAVCAHDFLHTEVVQTALSVNPSLQLYVYLPKYCGQSDPCEACALGCHQELRDDKMDYYTEQHLLMMKACDHVLIPR